MPQTFNLNYIVMKKKTRKSNTVFSRKKAGKKVDSPLWLSPNNIIPVDESWHKIIDSSILQETFSSASKRIFSKKNYEHMMRQTQNQSESKYSIVWGRFLKRLFCCIYQFVVPKYNVVSHILEELEQAKHLITTNCC